MRSLIRLLVLPGLVAGCASYIARPLETGDAVARYHSRRLDDPTLGVVLDSFGARPTDGAWQDWQLATAAWVLRPERSRLNAEIRAAEAVRIAAGGRPQPGVGTETEYSFSGSDGEPRIGLAVATTFTLELGGKRGARLGRANAGVLAAVARAEEEAWGLRWRVRDAVLERGRGERAWIRSTEELALIDSVLVALRARYEGGGADRIEVTRMEAERQDWAAEVASRRREFQSGRARLAADVGLPSAELVQVSVSPDSLLACPVADRSDSLERLALTLRPELHRVLAEYQVAEGDVRVEAANSWPDLALGPGLFFDHGVNKWTIAFGLPSLPLNRNRGPIAEAEARREVSAQRVAEVQGQILGGVEEALAGCAAASEEMRALDLSAARERVGLTEAAYQRGEVGRLEVLVAQLELARASRRLGDAEARAQSAAQSLEHEVGVWSGAPAVMGSRKEGM